jgi:FlaA1/EpsC-like NDP-sugar epimerase
MPKRETFLEILSLSVRGRGRLAVTLMASLDAALIALGTVFGYYVRFEGAPPEPYVHFLPAAIAAGVAVYMLLFVAFGLYRLVLRYVGVDTVLRLAGATVIGAALLVTIDFVYRTPENLRLVPVSVLLVQALIALLGGAAVRLSVRVFVYMARGHHSGRRVLIVGAGDAGSLLLRDIETQPGLGLRVVGFLDDDPGLKRRTIRSVPVVGTTADIASAAEHLHVEEVLVALPSASDDVVRRILNAAADAGLQTRIMPQLVMAKGSVELADLRKVEVEDLLGREPAPIDVEQIAETIAGKVVAVTGAAGSIGSELCRQILRLKPKRLALLEIDESRLYELWIELERMAPGVSVMHICDIRDAFKLDGVFAAEQPQVVLHAAAYKHVPLMELEPDEAVKTNILGTGNVIAACEAHGVERFVLISTDKAAAPQSVMGITKAVAEHLALAACSRGRVKAVVVRFGNVLGSRGSVVPLFEEQLRHGGPLLVTHEEVTRFFMTIPEAARLVLQAQAISDGGDLFVLEMGEPVRIVDLARKMIALSGVPADIEFVGLRPAEKLHEVLVMPSEELVPSGCEKILLVNALPLPTGELPALISELSVLAQQRQTDAIRDAALSIVEQREPLA